MAFQAPKLTNAGKALYYDNMAGAQITITTIKMGSGTLAGPIANLTDLVEPVVVVDALATVRDNYVDVSGTFSNADLDQGFYWREIGVFAANPDDPENREADILYCYQNAYDTADYIPVASVETVEKNIVVPIIVGDAAAVSCTLDHSLVLATLKDLEDHENDKNAHPGLTHYDPIGSAEKAVLEHDKDDTSHEDIRTALSNKVSHFGNVTKFDTVLAAASALTVDGTFFGDPSSSIYNAVDKPPNTTDVQYFVMLDGTTGQRVVLAVGYAATEEYRYFGTRDILNGAWLNEWRELATADELADKVGLAGNVSELGDMNLANVSNRYYVIGDSVNIQNLPEQSTGFNNSVVYNRGQQNVIFTQTLYAPQLKLVYQRHYVGWVAEESRWSAWEQIATTDSVIKAAVTQMISPPNSLDTVRALMPGNYSWVQSSALQWEPGDTPAGGIRVVLTVRKASDNQSQIFDLAYIDGGAMNRRYYGENGGTGIRWSKIATITSEPSTAGASAISAGTTDLSAGSSALTTGQIYLVYG